MQRLINGRISNKVVAEIWITADTHLGHGRIIKYCNRPFKDSNEMDERILSNFNEVIKPGDRLYHLGDVSWSSYNLDRFFGRLNTKEVHLIYGNHDKAGRTAHPNIRSYADMKTLSAGGYHALLCHYPLRSWPGRGRGGLQLYGHCHGTLPGEGRQMDVGVDTNGYYPWNWESICARLSKIPIGYEEGNQ